MKRAIITGAGGILGSALVTDCLEKGIEVLAILRPNSPNRDRLPQHELLSICECELDALDELQMQDKKWDVLYHFAWEGVKSQARDDETLQFRNVGHSCRAVRLAKRFGCHLFVGASSQAVYGVRPPEITSPQTPLNPTTAYGAAKIAAERETTAWAEQNEIAAVWVRVFSIYGPTDAPGTMIADAVSQLKQGIKPKFSAGTQLWDYLYCADAAQAFRLIGEHCNCAKTYCLGSGSSRPLREYITEIRDIVAPDAQLGFGEIQMHTKPTNLWADIGDLTNDTGFRVRTPFEEGIRAMI